ncbi:alpha-hydroxy-acid oxidizing protein [Parapusillimonas granuli]|uniref:Alpha-hydroxy-acid oxidizing protein n=2 Tax=Parapusillimonas granuli TaxID=380911 RepID=A0A853FU32_9BURK|nr:alpha-hydroxy-acid oxidizing protein [Parapusillimonas granuli]
MGMNAMLSIADLQKAAKRRLPAGIYGYVDGASEDHRTLRANRSAFERWAFTPHALVDVSRRSQSTGLFGKTWSMPIGIGPMGVCGVVAYDGDCALARAAASAGVPFVLSAASTTPMERVLRENPDAWYQAYLPANMAVIEPLLQRVRAAGVGVLVVTVDVPIASTRENELRNGFSIPLRWTPKLVVSGMLKPGWLLGTFARTLARQGIPHFENFTAERGGPIIVAQKGDHRAGRAAMSWKEIRAIRDSWKGKLVVKGILRAEDARTAESIGVDGVFVSNHGGRQLDGAVSTLAVLPEIAAATTRAAVIVDGGFRRGTDVIKAMALGADFVFAGRPFMYGLAAGGEAGARHALNLLKKEIDVDLALLGCPDLAEVDGRYLRDMRAAAASAGRQEQDNV